MKKFIEKIIELKQSNNAIFNFYWLDDNTFVVYFNILNDELQSIFPDLINKGENCSIYAEYHEEKHQIVYILEFDEDSIDMSDKIQSAYLDYLVLDKALNF